MENQKRISLRIKKTLLERIDRFAEKKHISRTQAIEMLLRYVLAQNNSGTGNDEGKE